MSETKRIRVAIVDDHEMIRAGLGVFVQAVDDLQLVALAADGAEALRLCSETEPDVVLMDLEMPGMDGVTATRAIRQRFPHIQIIALSSLADQLLIQEVLDSGAVAYLPKSVSIEEIAAAIRMARLG